MNALLILYPYNDFSDSSDSPRRTRPSP